MTMTTDRDAVTTDVDLTPVTDAVRRAAASLRTADSDPLDAVAWASAHLAAVERTLLPAADRVDDGDHPGTAELRRTGRSLQRELRQLEQVLNGDALTARTDAAGLRRRILVLLDELATTETAVFAR